MFARLFRLLLLAAALLLGQLGGTAHALGHVQNQDQDRPHAPCQLCVAYAAFDHAATAAPGLLPSAAVCPRPAEAVADAVSPLSSARYRARAPPPPLA